MKITGNKSLNSGPALGLVMLQAVIALPSAWPVWSRRHLAVFGITLLVFGLALFGLDHETQQAEHVGNLSLELQLPSQPLGVPDAASELAGTLDTARSMETASWQEVTVRSGQTLDTIFRQQGLDANLLHQILALNGDTKGLTRIRPGDVFGFQFRADGGFARMRYPLDEGNFLLVESSNGQLMATRLPRQLHFAPREAEGVISSSLFTSAKGAGLSDPVIMQLAEIFAWDIDFALDIRKGDRFYVVYEQVYRDGVFLRDGDILAATFVNQDERFQAVRFALDGTARYYSPDGRPMRKAFLRAPLNFLRVSSSFNPRRMHPILKKIRAHNGIDYSAPRGTPVFAAGDGTVIRSTYSATNGHHVFIRHSGGIETRYLHFTKRGVNNGVRVHQGQVIGWVGDTGLATAPHLHYEFLVNGTHRNPRTIALPQVDPLAGAELASFQAHAAPFLSQLARRETASLYALRE